MTSSSTPTLEVVLVLCSAPRDASSVSLEKGGRGGQGTGPHYGRGAGNREPIMPTLEHTHALWC